MAHVEHVLSVVSVSNIDEARAWYTRLFGREPDNNPMPNFVEWQLTGGGWVQVAEDQRRAGHSLLNLAVSDIEEAVRETRECGITTGEIVDANKGVRLCEVNDPDSNVIQLVGNFRVTY